MLPLPPSKNLRLHPVGRVVEVGDHAAGWYQCVTGCTQLIIEAHVLHRQEALQLRHGSGTDEGCGDPGLLLDPEDRELGCGQARFLGQTRESLADFDTARRDPVGIEAPRRAAREFSG